MRSARPPSPARRSTRTSRQCAHTLPVVEGASLRQGQAELKTRPRKSVRALRPTRAASVRTTVAAAAHVGALGQLFALLYLEGVAAAARRDGVRVVDLEARLLD